MGVVSQIEDLDNTVTGQAAVSPSNFHTQKMSLYDMLGGYSLLGNSRIFAWLGRLVL
jgi:hypothetical protein